MTSLTVMTVASPQPASSVVARAVATGIVLYVGFASVELTASGWVVALIVAAQWAALLLIWCFPFTRAREPGRRS